MMSIQQHGEGIFTIDSFLSWEECAQLIERSELLGYQPADVDIHGQRQMLNMVRNNERVDLESSGLATKLWERLHHYALPMIDGQGAIGLTPFFRFYRYEGAQKFNMHKDGKKEYEGNSTRLTLLVYLNNLDNTGATRFRDAQVDVIPQAGKALLFRHELWHAGMPVNDGVKYVLRTDVLFSRGAMA